MILDYLPTDVCPTIKDACGEVRLVDPEADVDVLRSDGALGSAAVFFYLITCTAALGLRLQPVDATHLLNRSAGVLNSSVFRGRSLSCLATAFNRF